MSHVFKLAILSGACLIGATGCQKKNEFVPPPPPEVTVSKPARKDVVVYVGLPGRTQAKESIEIRARVNGYLKSIDFEDGQLVTKGQRLFVIEPEPYIASVAAAEANHSSALAAEAIAQTNVERREQAYKTKAVSEIDLLTALANLDSAKAAVLNAGAALTQAQIELSYTTNTAPATGRIGRRQVSAGNLVGGAQATLLTTLVVQDPMDVYFTVNERILLPKLKKLTEMEADQAKSPDVFLELADGSRYPDAGRVDYIANRADPETGTVTIRAVFENKNGGLLPGLYGKILVPEKHDRALLVPDMAVQRDLGGTFLLVVGAGNEVSAKYVKLGAKVGANRIIDSGLDGSEDVVVNGIQRARPGIKVVPKPVAMEVTETAEVVEE